MTRCRLFKALEDPSFPQQYLAVQVHDSGFSDPLDSFNLLVELGWNGEAGGTMTVVIRIPLAGIILILIALLLIGGMVSYSVFLAIGRDNQESVVVGEPPPTLSIDQQAPPEGVTLEAVPQPIAPVSVPRVVSQELSTEEVISPEKTYDERNRFDQIEMPFVSEASRRQTAIDRAVSQERGAIREFILKNSRPVVVSYGDPGSGRRLLPSRTRWDEDTQGPKPNDLRTRGVSHFESVQVLASPYRSNPVGPGYSPYGHYYNPSTPIFVPVPVVPTNAQGWDIPLDKLLAELK